MTETPECPEHDAIKFLHAGDDRVWCVGCKRFAWCDGDNECPKDDASECPIQNEPDAVAAPSIADAQEALDALAKECRDLDDSLLAAPLASSLGEPVSQEAPYDWEGSYTMLRDALEANLGEFIRDGEEAEEYLYVQGIERAASVISSASPLSEDTKRLDFLQAWCNDMFWTRDRNPVGEPRLTLSWFIGDGGSPAFDTTGDDWRDAIDQARVKMGDIDRLSSSAPSPEADKPKPRALRQVRPHTVGSAYICGRCAKSHVVGCDPNGIVGGRPCPNSPSPEDKGSEL